MITRIHTIRTSIVLALTFAYLLSAETCFAQLNYLLTVENNSEINRYTFFEQIGIGEKKNLITSADSDITAIAADEFKGSLLWVAENGSQIYRGPLGLGEFVRLIFQIPDGSTERVLDIEYDTGSERLYFITGTTDGKFKVNLLTGNGAIFNTLASNLSGDSLASNSFQLDTVNKRIYFALNESGSTHSSLYSVKTDGRKLQGPVTIRNKGGINLGINGVVVDTLRNRTCVSTHEPGSLRMDYYCNKRATKSIQTRWSRTSRRPQIGSIVEPLNHDVVADRILQPLSGGTGLTVASLKGAATRSLNFPPLQGLDTPSYLSAIRGPVTSARSLYYRTFREVRRATNSTKLKRGTASGALNKLQDVMRSFNNGPNERQVRKRIKELKPKLNNLASLKDQTQFNRSKKELLKELRSFGKYILRL